MKLYFSTVKKDRRNLFRYFDYYNKPDCIYHFHLLTAPDKFEDFFDMGKVSKSLKKTFFNSWFLKNFDYGKELKNRMVEEGIFSYVICFDPYFYVSDVNYEENFCFAVVKAYKETFDNRRQYALFFHRDTKSLHFHSLVHLVDWTKFDWTKRKVDLSFEKHELLFLKEELQKRLKVIFNIYKDENKNFESKSLRYDRERRKEYGPEKDVSERIKNLCRLSLQQACSTNKPIVKPNKKSRSLFEIEVVFSKR